MLAYYIIFKLAVNLFKHQDLKRNNKCRKRLKIVNCKYCFNFTLIVSLFYRKIKRRCAYVISVLT